MGTVMIARDLNLDTYFVGLKYFEKIRKKVDHPSATQIAHALDRLQQDIDNVTRTVEVWRMPTSESLTNQFCMQLQGEQGKFIISLAKDYEMFATPNFDMNLGARGTISVIGNMWASSYVCTNFEMAKEIAIEFALKGTLAYPEIWEIL